MGNLAKGSPLIKKLFFFVSYLTRAESHRAGTGKETSRKYPKTGERYSRVNYIPFFPACVTALPGIPQHKIPDIILQRLFAHAGA